MACYSNSFQEGRGVGGLGIGSFFVDGEKKIDHMGRDWCPQGINQFFQDYLNHIFKHRPSITMFAPMSSFPGERSASSRNHGFEDTCTIVNTGPRSLAHNKEIVAVPPICKYNTSAYIAGGLEGLEIGLGNLKEHRFTLQTFDANSYKRDLTNLMILVRIVADDVRTKHTAYVFGGNFPGDMTVIQKLAELDGATAINNLYSKAMDTRGVPGTASQQEARELFKEYMTTHKRLIANNVLYRDCVKAVECVTNLDVCDELDVFMHILTHLAKATNNIAGIASKQNDKHYGGIRLCFTQDQLRVVKASMPDDMAGALVDVDTHMKIRSLIKQNTLDEINSVGVVCLACATSVYPKDVCRVRNIGCRNLY